MSLENPKYVELDKGVTINMLVGVPAEGGPDLTGSNVVVSMEVMKPDLSFDVALQEDGGSFIDETPSLDDSTKKDLDLLPDVIVEVNDAFYLGANVRFSAVEIDIGQAGVGSWTIIVEYWNGSTWADLSATDGTNAFKTLGKNRVYWTYPTDWAKTVMDNKGPYYYVRFRITAGDPSPTTQPLGNSARISYDVISASVTDASNGQISATIPEGLFDEAGTYRFVPLFQDGTDTVIHGKDVEEIQVVKRFDH